MSYKDIVKNYATIFPFSEQKLNFLLKRFENVQSCLDIGCGIGNYTHKLTESGIECIGLDVDTAMLRKANENYPNDKFIEASMLEFDKYIAKVDATFCFGNTLAYLKESELVQFLEKLYKALPKGGIWIFQVMNWDYVLTWEKYGFTDVYLEDVMTTPEPLKFRRWYENITPESLKFHRQMMEGRCPISHSTDILFPQTKDKFVEIHKKCGFELKEFYADFAETEYSTTKDTALVMVFNKV